MICIFVSVFVFLGPGKLKFTKVVCYICNILSYLKQILISAIVELSGDIIRSRHNYMSVEKSCAMIFLVNRNNRLMISQKIFKNHLSIDQRGHRIKHRLFFKGNHKVKNSIFTVVAKKVGYNSHLLVYRLGIICLYTITFPIDLTVIESIIYRIMSVLFCC